MAQTNVHRTLVALALGLLLLVASGCRSADSTPPNSGIEGLVTIGPSCPAVRDDQPCPDKPYSGELVITTPNGDEVARAHSGADGHYRITLKPGSYLVVPQSQPNSQLPFSESVLVSVLRDTFIVVNIAYDSGIR